jgi:hypothetical protein
MEVGLDGGLSWAMRDPEDEIEARAAALFALGYTVRDTADGLRISKSRAGRLRKEWESSKRAS